MTKKNRKKTTVRRPPPVSAAVAPVVREKLAPVVLTQQDLCDLLQISRTKLYRMEKITPVPGRVVLGGSVRYYREQVLLWLESGCPYES